MYVYASLAPGAKVHDRTMTRVHVHPSQANKWPTFVES